MVHLPIRVPLGSYQRYNDLKTEKGTMKAPAIKQYRLSITQLRASSLTDQFKDV